MENASRALLIAGGVLLSLIIIAVGMMMVNNMREVAEAADERVLAEQLRRFNRRFESYDRQLLYGQEVITVINMAIDNNLRRAYDDHDRLVIDEEAFVFVNIILVTTSDFQGYWEVVQRRFEEGRDNRIGGGIVHSPSELNDMLVGHLITNCNCRAKTDDDITGLLANRHELRSGAYFMDPNVVNFFNNRMVNPPPCREEHSATNTIESVYEFSPLSEFRRATFYSMPEYIQYTNGRISQMKFRQR